jgi:hypothetical protein
VDVALRRAAAGHAPPAKPEDVRQYVEGLVTDAAALVFKLERERLAIKRRYRDALLAVAADERDAADPIELLHDQRDIEAQIDELRRLMAAVRSRFALPAA